MKLVKMSALFGIAALAAAQPSHATVYFQNEGNLSGWGNTSTCPSCTLSAVSSPSYNGNGSIEARCNYTTSGLRYHCEPTTYGSWNSGTVYFGYALYLPTNWEFSGTNRNVTEQWGTWSNGSTIKPDYYQAWIGGGNPSEYQISGVGGGSDLNCGTMTSGAWHTIVTKITYGSGGNITVWFDGNQTASASGTVDGGGGGNPDGLWAVGLYEADWDGGNTGNGTSDILYNADTTIASSYSEAAPVHGGASLPSGYHSLLNVNSGLDIVVQGGAITALAKLIQFTNNGTTNGKWEFVADGSTYAIRNENSGMDINIPGPTTTQGTQLIQYNAGTASNEEWSFVPDGGGEYTITSVYDGEVIDVSGSSKTNGAIIDQWPGNGGANQRWTIN